MSEIPRDVTLFLRGYPGQRDDTNRYDNLKFYRGAGNCVPDGLKYEEWMERYENDYKELEMNHSYIQWFFPIPEQGVNPHAKPLLPHEQKAMSEDVEVLKRILRSYKMMLGFYGIKMNNDGGLRLADNADERLANLAARSHNLLRITRIIKCISLFPSLQPHAAPLVLFFVALHSDGKLPMMGMRGDSLERWWGHCFRDERESEEVQKIILARGRPGGGRWGFEKYDQWLDARGRRGMI
ncbi:hypothetical protein M231_03597 [Tremella mesenterica]|uniref:Opioid growth factor receptor (OGFr) conserved domain-containing protein n=1 Tax=Tremella mesenterica TaxID=5217 RepID=A0A4Q1BN39_TREME|nr:hypothetical protein M231_03597 [Tremella mesenterica]